MTPKSLLTFAIITAGLCLSATAGAQDSDAALKALDDALPGDLLHNPLDLEWEKRGNDLRTKIVDAEGPPSGRAVRVEVKKRQTRPWDSVIYTEIEDGVKKGETVQAYFWVRTDKAAAGRDTADIILFVGRNEEPYDYIISEDITPGEDWKLSSLSGVAGADFPSGELKVEYQLGRSKQTIEIGAVYVSTLGQSGM
ncbi:MAG: carbohydrate binding domain-containing protein [Hyphomonadaceae bacterium]|nr:carbohydrate binding domain-containing protein [Hyphomonadaceae bacterium]MBC6412462.1 carbohydrate binding domain-containing protein [Hyphomonadaceae bacterium]